MIVEFVCVLLVIGILGVLVWQYSETKRAVDTTSVSSPHDRQQTIEIINTAFDGARSILWTDASGPGTLNKRRRGTRGGITMSIDIEPLSGGGSRVDMWASQTNSYLGVFVNFAGVVNRRKKAIVRLLVGQVSYP
jgi:hypothetical protein